MSDSEIQATAEQRLKNKVEEMKKEQEAAIQKTKQAEQQTPQPSAADKSPVQAVGIIKRSDTIAIANNGKRVFPDITVFRKTFNDGRRLLRFRPGSRQRFVWHVNG